MIKIEVKMKKPLSEMLDAEIKKERKKIMLNAVTKLRDATPIDTGAARTAWELGKLDRIENDKDYIYDLNRGTSRQAGPRFIERTLLSTGDFVPNGRMVSKS